MKTNELKLLTAGIKHTEALIKKYPSVASLKDKLNNLKAMMLPVDNRNCLKVV